MRKIISALVALILLVCFAAFGEEEITVIVNEDGSEWNAPANGDAISIEKDLGVIVNGVFYKVYTPADALIAALGEPSETISSPSCVFVGEDFEYSYEYGSVYSSPIDEMNIWYEFYILDIGMTTTRGLSVGDTVEKMLELYGENYYSEGEGMYTYSLSGDPDDYASPCLIFETEDGIVVTIDVYYPTNI